MVVAVYVPLHLWRRATDRRDGLTPLGSLPVVQGSPGGVDLDPAMGEPVLAPQSLVTESMASDTGPISPLSTMRSEIDL